MPTITGFRRSKDGERVFIDLDGQYAISVRDRTFDGLGLQEGMEITKGEIRERDLFFWKNKYQKNGGWEREELRLKRVEDGLRHCDERFVITRTGFGAGSLEFIARHPQASGSPDLSVSDSEGNLIVCVEVTGTERMKGRADEFWVRPDKIRWARDNPGIESWVALHYAQPQERMIFFRPEPGREYPVEERLIGDSRERFAILTREDVIVPNAFVEEIRALSERHFRQMEAEGLSC